MADFGRKARKDSKAQDASEPEVTEVAEVIEVEPTEDTDADFDNLMASFTNADDESAEEDVKEMSKQDQHDAQDVSDAEVIEDANAPTDEDAKDSALSDAAKEIADKATGKTVTMLSVETLPPTVPHIKMAITGLEPFAKLIKEAVEEWNANTSGNDAKVKHAIATLTEESDAEAFAKREAIVKAKAEIARLEELIETEEPKLYASVEAKLAEQGDVMWSEDTKNEKREYINNMYAGYVQSHKGVEQFIEAHNKTAIDANKVGTLDQYHTKLEKPFKRVGSASGGTGVRKTSGAPRNVSVSEASVSYDGGVTWNKAEGRFAADKDLVSNPTFLSADIAKVSKESGSVLKERIYTEWYGANGSADGSPIEASEVKDVTEFDLNYLDKSGEGKTAKVRIVKKTKANE